MRRARTVGYGTVASRSVSQAASIRLPWRIRFHKPPLSSRSVGFPKDRLATMTFPADLPMRAQAKVLTNIHPLLRRFVSLLGTYLQYIYLGSESGTHGHISRARHDREFLCLLEVLPPPA